MEDWRTAEISKAEERSAAYRNTRTLRSWLFTLTLALAEAVAVIGALMVFTDSLEAKSAFIGIAAAGVLHGSVAVGEYVYRRWRVRADILTSRLVRANTEYDRVASRLPQPPVASFRILHGDGRWALEIENQGGPADFEGRIDVLFEGDMNSRPLRWTDFDSPTATVGRVRLLQAQKRQVLIGTMLDYGDSYHWSIHSGFTLAPRSTWSGTQPGPPTSPDLAQRFQVKDNPHHTAPVALVSITLTTEPSFAGGPVVRRYIFDLEGLREIAGGQS